MRRDAAALAGRFDLLVIGGGIAGAWTAYDAALRGLSVALVERDDWAAATSSASSKLIHGGLRYLEYGRLGLVATSLRERSRLLRLAPHRVHPLEFLLPVYPDGRAGRLPLALGLSLYDLLAGAGRAVPRHRAFAAEELVALAPFLARDRLAGGFAYADALDDDARMTLEIVAGALAAGAVAVNHAAAVSFLRGSDARAPVEGALIEDGEGGRRIEVRAAVTVAAAGPWITRLPGLPPDERAARLTKGVHLVMPPIPGGRALTLTAPSDRRVFFLIPWYGATLVGTTDTDHAGDPAAVRVEDADVAYLLAAARARCPGLGWGEAQVRGAFAGLRTLRREADGAPSSISREWGLEQPLPRLLVPVGGKLTSARAEAARIVDRVVAALGRGVAACRTADRPFPWRPRAPWADWLVAAVAAGERLGLDAEVADAAARRHGARLPALHALIAREPALARRLHRDAPFCRGEAVVAVTDEMALALVDVLRRRLPLAILARLDRSQIDDAAALAGAALGWDAARRGRETDSVLALQRRG